MNPRASTLDEVQPVSGLPTLSIREVLSTVRLRSDEAVLISGLDADLRFDTRDRVLLLPGGRRSNRDQTALVVLVRARLA
jgi:hypothetical protein